MKVSSEGEVSTMVGCGYPARERPPGVAEVDVAIVDTNEVEEEEGLSGDELSDGESASKTNPVSVSQGKRLGEGRVGEIWVKSPSVAKGYWGKEEKSKEDFGATIEGEEGTFLRTGDQVD